MTDCCIELFSLKYILVYVYFIFSPLIETNCLYLVERLEDNTSLYFFCTFSTNELTQSQN